MRNAQPCPLRSTSSHDDDDAWQPNARRLCGDVHSCEIRATGKGVRRSRPDRLFGTNEFAQPCSDGYLGAEAERGGGVLGRPERMEDVAGARGPVEEGWCLRIVACEHADHLEQRRRAAGANVGDTR